MVSRHGLQVLVFICALAMAGAHGGTVHDLRLWSGPSSTRVVLDLSHPVEHRIFKLGNPNRIVIDLKDSELLLTKAMPAPRGFVVGVRTGDRGGGTLRVVLDLAVPVHSKSFLLKPNEIYGHRLVIDLAFPGKEPVVQSPLRVPEKGWRDLVIAIDPGHGGEDPGATGPQGVREKEVVLEIARRLAEEAHRQTGIQPVLLRDDDYFLSLRERMQLARENEADLFISIHADAFRDDRIRGATVYVLSEQGASDEAARRLAERENASDLIGGVSLFDKDQVLARVLLDLSQSAAISTSAAVGSRVIDRLTSVTQVRKSKVQRAPFLVLKSPDIPSLLIETAYISNYQEEATLRDPGYQVKLAQAIQAGLVDHFRANPPQDSYFALNASALRLKPARHVITRGETLSEIAEQYKVSLSKLRRLNNLTTDVIRIGQVINIPSG
ncbi:MAG: N-acetylmuramoyl-L-alanine amidase [Gammaproteobacteria bacterium]